MRKGREDLITLLTKDCSKLQAYHAMVAATRHNDVKVFRRFLAVLAAEVGELEGHDKDSVSQGGTVGDWMGLVILFCPVGNCDGGWLH